MSTTFTNANGPVTGFTDSDGVFVLTGVTGGGNLTPAKYGYTFNPAGWANPLTVASDILNADFRARHFTNVTLVLSTNLVAENVLTTNQLTLIPQRQCRSATT